MARQFREQLEEEVQLEQARRTQTQTQQASPPSAAAPPTDATGASTLAAGETSPTPRADERGT